MRRLLLPCAAILVLSVAACLRGTAVPSVPDIATTTFASALNVNLGAMTKTTDGLYYQDSIVGTGATAVSGDSVWVKYIGWLPDGTKFDASSDHGADFPFQLGIGYVIQGWDEGLVGVKVGGWRKLVIPPSLGYGPYNNGGIPANSILVFNVQIDSVK